MRSSIHIQKSMREEQRGEQSVFFQNCFPFQLLFKNLTVPLFGRKGPKLNILSSCYLNVFPRSKACDILLDVPVDYDR